MTTTNIYWRTLGRFFSKLQYQSGIKALEIILGFIFVPWIVGHTIFGYQFSNIKIFETPTHTQFAVWCVQWAWGLGVALLIGAISALIWTLGSLIVLGIKILCSQLKEEWNKCKIEVQWEIEQEEKRIQNQIQTELLS